MAFLEIKTNKAIYYMECANVYITAKEIKINNNEMTFKRNIYVEQNFGRTIYDEYERAGVKDECLKYIKKDNGDYLYKHKEEC